MKVTGHVEITGAGMPYEKSFPLLKKLGAQGVELVVRETGILSLDTPKDQLKRIMALSSELDLPVSGLTSGYSWTQPMTSGSPLIRQKGSDSMKRIIELAAYLKTDSVLIVPGYARTEFVSPSETVPVPLAMERALEGVREAGTFGAEANVSVNVEVVWGGMLRTAQEMRRFLDQAAAPGIGFYLDTGNVFPEGDPLRWIGVMGPYIRRVHMKDFDPRRRGLECFCPLGEGVVPFPAIVQALREEGYDGWIGAEHHLNKSEQDAAHSMAFLHNLIEKRETQ